MAGSGIVDYDVEMFERRHPNFFGAVFATDTKEPEIVHVASEQ
jgi:hypothetical protein